MHSASPLGALLFNSSLPIQYPYTKSSFTVDGNSNTAEIMRASFGQHTTTVSPLHMVLITSAIANDGVYVQPKIVDKITNTAITSTSVKPLLFIIYPSFVVDYNLI